MSAAHFTLDSDGSFLARRSRAAVRIAWQPRMPRRWNLRIEDTSSGARILDTDHHTLDDAFADAAAVLEIERTGWGPLVRIEVGEDDFHRPGKMSAETILDRFGYVLVDTLQIFVVDTFPDYVDAGTVRQIFADRLSATGAQAGAVNCIGMTPGEASWCVDAVLPVSGCFHRDRLAEAAADLVSAAEAGTLVSCNPLAVSRIPVEAEPAAVLRFARAG
jgi:hypothetical protein